MGKSYCIPYCNINAEFVYFANILSPIDVYVSVSKAIIDSNDN